MAALVGWEWMAPHGPTLRSSIGPSYEPPWAGLDSFFFAINILSVDYKIW